MKATLTKRASKPGQYDFKEGDEFEVVRQFSTLTVVTDGLGFQYYLRTADLKFEGEKNEKFRVNVFVTKNCKFRAEVQRPDGTFYQVTVGGQEWKKGKGEECRQAIIHGISKILGSLNNQVKEILE